MTRKAQIGWIIIGSMLVVFWSFAMTCLWAANGAG